MSDLTKIQRQKTATSTYTQPTLAGKSTQGFGLSSSSPPQSIISSKSHDISRISLRPQAKISVSQPENSDSIIQRDDVPGLTWGDWKFPLPTPKGETDDRYDTPENRRRAERQDEDERSGDPKPNEWWKPQQPQMPPSPGKCPEDRWNWVFNTCCPVGKHKDPSGPNCIPDNYNIQMPLPQNQPQQPPQPTNNPGDWNQLDQDTQYA